MQYPGQHQQCDNGLFWGSVVICTVCVAIVQRLVFVLVLRLPVFVAEAGSGKVKAVYFS